jgi:NAD+ synthetase
MNYLTRTEGELDLLKCSKLVLDLQQGIRSMAEAVVVGLSGGADSTLVAALSVLALGRANVVGLHMPYGAKDHSHFNSRSKKLAEHLGILNYTLPIDQPVSFAEKTICFGSGQDIVLGQFSQGNLRSRMRMVYLYGVCGQMAQDEASTGLTRRWRVAGTGNLSEDYISYDTKGGDALADFFPIGDLYKQEVYDLLDYLASIHVIKEEHIDRVPSAGL